MTNRQRVNAIMHYENYDAVPVVSFGYWRQTLQKWAAEGHISAEEAKNWADGNPADYSIMSKLGFDFNWCGGAESDCFLYPPFETEVVQELPDGSLIARDGNGLLTKTKPGVTSIPAHAGTSLTGREAWEELYLPRLKYCASRVNAEEIKRTLDEKRALDIPAYVYMGSMFGKVRDMLGIEELAYLKDDDEDLYIEVVNTVDGLCYECAKAVFELGCEIDYVHFWEDICFKNGPLIRPAEFAGLCGPWYKKITGLANSHGVDIVSVDCDGLIDQLVPVWLENGVNTMFPIEVGTWNASLAPWRAKYGRALRGVGGMDKRVFAADFKAVDAEIERLKPLIDAGGYIPCPDHRIAPDAKWDNVRYYCDRFRAEFT